MVILAVAAWILVGVVVLGVTLLTDLGARRPSVDQPLSNPRASMRLLFVTMHDGHVVIDGLLDVAGASTGMPTTWTFELPADPVLAAATARVLERWTAAGESVVVDLSKVTRSHPLVAFAHDDVVVWLSALRRTAPE